ncbi:MAG: DUF2513 domain-containing protein [Anaerolineae bacterium]|nr:DUF2513 domain-containing protein [Anaerolineae bacterium]
MNDLASSRDMDLVRKILFELEKMLPGEVFEFDSLKEVPSAQINYHLELMSDNNLVRLYDKMRDSASVRLMWEGHEFLEAVRDDKRWEKIKAEMSKSGGFVFEIAKSVALDFVEEEINPNRIQSLKSQLIRRYNNLNELEEQAANYGAAVVPLELKNQIKAEKEAIAELEEKLKILTG